MAAIHTGFTSTFGGIAAGPWTPFPVQWPGGPPEPGDVLVGAAIGYPEDEDALEGLVVGSTGGGAWEDVCREMVDGPYRPFALVVAWHRHSSGDGVPFVAPGAGWVSDGWEWTGVVGGYRGVLDDPDLIAVDAEALPSTPYGVPEVAPNRDTGLVTIVAQAQTVLPGLTVAAAGDFTVATSWGAVITTGGARRSLWLHDLEAYAPPAPAPVFPQINVRDTAIPIASGQLVACTFNLPIALFPPTGRRGPYLGLRR